MQDDTTLMLIKEVASIGAKVDALAAHTAEHNADSKERFDKLEKLLAAQNTDAHAVKNRVSRLELIVFGIGGPVGLIIVGALVKLLLKA
jgi:hypothetical protein